MALKHFPGSAWVYTKQEIEEARKNGQLLNCDIEVSKKCNLRCTFCYSESGTQLKDEMSVQEIKEIIRGVAEIGGKTITLTGGEPTIYPHFFELAEYINELGMKTLCFTNGTCITPKFAKQMYELKIHPCVSLESINPDIHDEMVGCEGAFQRTIIGIDNLIAAGYTDTIPLTTNSVITSKNYAYLHELWDYVKGRNIDPFFLRLIAAGRSREHNELYVATEEIEQLAVKISNLKNYDLSTCLPSMSQEGCIKHFFSCFITTQGYVQPCTGVNVFCGNVRQKNISTIIKESPIIRLMRNIDDHIQGECKECTYHGKCYGCRGVTYAQTGDLFGTDPLCWHKTKVG